MDGPTATALASLLTLLSTKALDTWGPFGFLLIVPGLIAIAKIWSLSRQLGRRDEQLAGKDQQIETLRKEISDLQAKRLEDAKETMRLARTGTETMTARSDHDEAILSALTRLTQTVGDLSASSRSRRPSR